jgi:hypothetical protein
LLVPTVGLLIGMKADLAALKARQDEHSRRLDRMEKKVSDWAALGAH